MLQQRRYNTMCRLSVYIGDCALIDTETDSWDFWYDDDHDVKLHQQQQQQQAVDSVDLQDLDELHTRTHSERERERERGERERETVNDSVAR